MKISRRKSLQAAVATITASGLSGLGKAASILDPSTADKFNASLEDHSWLKVFQNVSALDLPSLPANVSGKWPSGLSGTLFRNGPAHFERDGHRYEHWFDGDGMIQKWDMYGSQVSHRARITGTSKFNKEESAQQHRVDGFATKLDREFVMHPDDLNTANTSVVYHGEELWALWEGGSPHVIEQDSLATRGPKIFSPDADGIAFSAHPRLDQSGSLWNFGIVSHLGKLAIWEIARTGTLRQLHVIDVNPITMPHDFVVTENYIAILLPPLWYNLERVENSSFLHSHEWHAGEPTRVLVIDKNELNNHFFAELPAQWVFHFSNAWEDNSVIQFEGCSYKDPSIMYDVFSSFMAGQPSTSTDVFSNLTRYQVDLKTHRVSQEVLIGRSANLEFPTFDRRLSSAKHRWLNLLGAKSSANHQAQHGLLNTLIRLDSEEGVQQTYTFPDTEIPEEHLFVPDPSRSRENAGWIVGTSIDWDQEQTRLNVFEPNHLSDGPVASAAVQRLMPLGLHGCYV